MIPACILGCLAICVNNINKHAPGTMFKHTACVVANIWKPNHIKLISFGHGVFIQSIIAWARLLKYYASYTSFHPHLPVIEQNISDLIDNYNFCFFTSAQRDGQRSE